MKCTLFPVDSKYTHIHINARKRAFNLNISVHTPSFFMAGTLRNKNIPSQHQLARERMSQYLAGRLEAGEEEILMSSLSLCVRRDVEIFADWDGAR